MRLIQPVILVINLLILSGCQTTAPDHQVASHSAEKNAEQSIGQDARTSETASLKTDAAKAPTHSAMDTKSASTATNNTLSCPTQPTPKCTTKKSPIGDMLIIGEVENTRVSPGDFVTAARIDTGATTTSIHAFDVVEFERDGKKWVKFKTLAASGKGSQELEQQVTRMVSIKRHGAEDTIRYAVNMTLTIGTTTQRIEVTLADRSSFDYKVLVGRNLLKDLFVVDVGKKLTAGTPTISAN